MHRLQPTVRFNNDNVSVAMVHFCGSSVAERLSRSRCEVGVGSRICVLGVVPSGLPSNHHQPPQT